MKNHEIYKCALHDVVAAYCQRNNIEYKSLGWVPMRPFTSPDDVFVINGQMLAIVIARSSSLDIATFRQFEVPELWYWHEEALFTYCLDDGKYVHTRESWLLPGLSLARLEQLVIEHVSWPGFPSNVLIRRFFE
jgi:hypothetical protein